MIIPVNHGTTERWKVLHRWLHVRTVPYCERTYILGLLEDGVKKCTAKAITNDPKPGENVVFKEPAESQHEHPLDREKVAAIQLSPVAKNPGQPPSQILRWRGSVRVY